MSEPFFTVYPTIGVLITLVIWFAAGDRGPSSTDAVMPLFCALMAIAWPAFVAWWLVMVGIDLVKTRRPRR